FADRFAGLDQVNRPALVVVEGHLARVDPEVMEDRGRHVLRSDGPVCDELAPRRAAADRLAHPHQAAAHQYAEDVAPVIAATFGGSAPMSNAEATCLLVSR